ncbi:MAG: hypothetical protein A3E85_00720 [Gammaproteobacteria bacterium RIFCSPHIGHO2_12_FULL_45_12]|nr:MAG: hypothetical protein A3E85_00720 [Gammaproteobacteria bacterium RIFCSPHIGHO2_12_FULL_45_12]
MQPSTDPHETETPWQVYARLGIEVFVLFYLATFCMLMFATHPDHDWFTVGALLTALYLFVIASCAKRIINTLTAPGLMLLVPIAPLLVLITVVTCLPLIQMLY